MDTYRFAAGAFRPYLRFLWPKSLAIPATQCQFVRRSFDVGALMPLGLFLHSAAMVRDNEQMMKMLLILLLSSLAFAQSQTIRREHWGMTQNEVIAAEKSAPLKRTAGSLVYRDKELGLPCQVLFEFTAGRLDQISYVLDSPSANPETSFLKWVLDLTKRYGTGMTYLDKKPIGRAGTVIDTGLKQLWKRGKGEILVVFPPDGPTYVGVGVTVTRTEILVEEDFATAPMAGTNAEVRYPKKAIGAGS